MAVHQEELKSKYNVISASDNELLVNIYSSTKSFEFLRDIDGYYAATLYDKNESKVYLITDRYGFKPLYWSIIKELGERFLALCNNWKWRSRS